MPHSLIPLDRRLLTAGLEIEATKPRPDSAFGDGRVCRNGHQVSDRDGSNSQPAAFSSTPGDHFCGRQGWARRIARGPGRVARILMCVTPIVNDQGLVMRKVILDGWAATLYGLIFDRGLA